MLLLTEHTEPSFACIVDHDVEECNNLPYHNSIYEIANNRTWTTISMKDDFRMIFDPQVEKEIKSHLQSQKTLQ
ncbi:MAG: hypothetical protein OEM28_03535 [Nitrosopumilus sp.]|nr:hypothetical protein [Nitrosopumilus sp.]